MTNHRADFNRVARITDVGKTIDFCKVDDSGQLLTGSMMDYCLPKADNIPNFDVTTNVTPCTHNVLGVKGCGEAGAIGSPPAVINAVLNALSDYNVENLQMPATPERVWQAMQSNG